MSLTSVTFCNHSAAMAMLKSTHIYHAIVVIWSKFPSIISVFFFHTYLGVHTYLKEKKNHTTNDSCMLLDFWHVPCLLLGCNNMLSKFVSIPFILLLSLALLSPYSEKFLFFHFGKNLSASPDHSNVVACKAKRRGEKN